MKTKFFTLIAALLICAATMAKPDKTQKPAPVTGYMVVVQQPGQKPETLKTIHLAEVYAVCDLVLQGMYIDIAARLQQWPYIEVEAGGRYFYIELRRVSESGRYKRMSKK